MSFSSEIRKSLCVIPKECNGCISAELAGIMSFSGQLNADMLRFVTEKKYIAKKIARNIEECTGIEVSYEGERNIRIEISDEETLDKIRKCTNFTDSDFEKKLIGECCKKAFIRGAFLGGGCVTDPDASYHLEFDTKYKISAERLCSVIEEFGIVPKLTYRKGHYLVYLKGSDDIAHILGLIGANMGALKFYSVQMEKDVRNSINRQINCEVANQRKISKAATHQIAAIKKIKANNAMGKLPDVLQEIANLREKFPDASLKDLGEMITPPLGKSGVNHRLNRIIEYANQL